MALSAVDITPFSDARRLADGSEHLSAEGTRVALIALVEDRQVLQLQVREGDPHGSGETRGILELDLNNNNRDYPVRNALQFRRLLGQSPPDLELVKGEYVNAQRPSSSGSRSRNSPSRRSSPYTSFEELTLVPHHRSLGGVSREPETGLTEKPQARGCADAV